jgi:hypothetical protein
MHDGRKERKQGKISYGRKGTTQSPSTRQEKKEGVTPQRQRKEGRKEGKEGRGFRGRESIKAPSKEGSKCYLTRCGGRCIYDGRKERKQGKISYGRKGTPRSQSTCKGRKGREGFQGNQVRQISGATATGIKAGKGEAGEKKQVFGAETF